MARKSSRTGYAGLLAQPIYEPVRIGGLLDDPEQLRKEAADRAFARLKQKLPLLFDFFDIDVNTDTCWIALSLRLAVNHVPGLRILLESPPRRGRRKTWQAGLGDELLEAVRGLRNERV